MSSKKSSTTQQSQQTQTSTPTVPTWISEPTHNLSNLISGIVPQGSTAFTPTTSPLQQSVFNTASSYTPPSNYSDAQTAYGGVNPITSDPNAFTDATNAYNSVPNVDAQSLLTNLQSYYNPYESDVINPAMADFDAQAGVTKAQQAAQAALGGAFQGSRYGVQEAQTEDALSRARASTLGGLLNSAYTSATTLSGQDADRRQAAEVSNAQDALAKAAGLTGIDTTKSNQALTAQQATAQNQLAKAAGLAGIDSSMNSQSLQQLQLLDQIGGEATSAQQQQQQYPITFLAQMEGLLSGLNPGLYTGSTSTGSSKGSGTQTISDPMGQMTGLLGAGSSLFKGF